MQTEATTQADDTRPARPKPTVTVEWEWVTPELAESYLASNTENRPISKQFVRTLATELEEDRFMESHQGIAFDSRGVLLDGQHRLRAIIVSGIPAWLLVTRGLSRDVFRVIDQGNRRTAGQLLAMSGISKDAPRLAAMARSILSVAHNRARVSNTESTEYAILHSELLQKYLPVARKFTPPVAAAFAWCEDIGMLDPDELLECAKRLVDAAWTTADDPMRALFRRCEDMRPLGQGSAAVKAKFNAALTALQAVREGRGLKQIRKSDPDYKQIERTSRAAPASRIEYDEGQRDQSVIDRAAARLAQADEPVVERSVKRRQGKQQPKPVTEEDLDSKIAAAEAEGWKTPEHPAEPPAGSLASETTAPNLPMWLRKVSTPQP